MSSVSAACACTGCCSHPEQEEKCVRASQILDNETKRSRERREKEIDDKRTLAECKLKLRLEQEAQVRQYRAARENHHHGTNFQS